MDAETARRLRKRRAHRRVHIADRWRKRVMRDLKRRETDRKNQKEAPQRIGIMDVDTWEKEGTIVGVRRVHGSLAKRERETVTDEDDAGMQPDESSDGEWYVMM